MAQKRPFNEGKKHFKKNKKQKKSTSSDGSNEEVLLADVRRLLHNAKIDEDEQLKTVVPDQFAEVELDITELSSTGDGLGEKDGQVYVVPFTAPGDKVLAKVYRNAEEESYSLADFVKVLSSSQHRTETPKCPYFTQCSGCQFQHLPYTYQLAHKRSIVEKAYENFSGLPTASIPKVGETVGSPLQYGYRTKLTPHFDGPPGGRRDKRNGQKVTWPEVPPIGYMKKGTRKTMDIEDCPIGTEAVRLGLKKERKRVTEHINQYQRGATLLLRENTKRTSRSDEVVDSKHSDDPTSVVEDRGEYTHTKSCITDHKATSTEYIEDFRFDNPAGAFFQNNNSILPLVTQYIRDNILGSAESTTQPKIKNLVDAYCGSGFFTIILSALFENSIGIDISPQSIASATRNAELNKLRKDSTQFIAADATTLFASVDKTKFKPEETVVVIDPPRKGCDESFIRQLIAYGPERICYVSCNVHTQARDVGWLVGGFCEDDADDKAAKGGGSYEIESLRGFDFFPQTGHVEGVAFLKKRSAVGNDVGEVVPRAEKGQAGEQEGSNGSVEHRPG